MKFYQLKLENERKLSNIHNRDRYKSIEVEFDNKGRTSKYIADKIHEAINNVLENL